MRFEHNEILDRHKKGITCDICQKTVWFFQKGIRCVVRVKDNIWTEYYHIKCLEKRGYLRRVRKLRQPDKKYKEDEGTGNLVH